MFHQHLNLRYLQELLNHLSFFLRKTETLKMFKIRTKYNGLHNISLIQLYSTVCILTSASNTVLMKNTTKKVKFSVMTTQNTIAIRKH